MPARWAAKVAFKRCRSVSKLSNTAMPFAMPAMKSAGAMVRSSFEFCAFIAQ
jgi:hypothetical protein